MVRLGGSVALGLGGLPEERGCGAGSRRGAVPRSRGAGGEDAAAEQRLVEWRAKTRRLLFDRDRWRYHGAIAIALLKRESLTGRAVVRALLVSATHADGMTARRARWGRFPLAIPAGRAHRRECG